MRQRIPDPDDSELDVDVEENTPFLSTNTSHTSLPSSATAASASAAAAANEHHASLNAPSSSTYIKPTLWTQKSHAIPMFYFLLGFLQNYPRVALRKFKHSRVKRVKIFVDISPPDSVVSFYSYNHIDTLLLFYSKFCLHTFCFLFFQVSSPCMNFKQHLHFNKLC